MKETYRNKSTILKRNDSLWTYRTNALEIARQLSYGPEVCDKIKKAKNETQIANIMTEARKRMT